jgi:uncharacterized protein YdeI (YjbR/CyaY-like superfamily)
VTPRFFRSQAAFRRWLEKNHATSTELWVGMHKVSSGKGGLTYLEALEEALCFGWIDGVRRRFDEHSFAQRFTPRRPMSYWSAVNRRRAEALKAAGRMHPSGAAAFERRDKGSARYSFERRATAFDSAADKRFRANRAAWQFFSSQAPWYQRVAIHWVTSAKREETQARRLETLIRDSAAGRRIGLVSPKTPDA